MDHQIYKVKNVSFEGRRVPICLQSVNGPCPLLGMFNALSLRGNLTLDAGKVSRGFFTSRDLLSIIGDYMLTRNQSCFDKKDGVSANQRQILSDVLGNVLPKLQAGLDVNVRFGAVRDFEYTQELDAFYMLGLDLVHGWVVDADNAPLYRIAAKLSYNQLADRVIEINSRLDALVKAVVDENKGRDAKEAAGPGDDAKGGAKAVLDTQVNVNGKEQVEAKTDGEDKAGDRNVADKSQPCTADDETQAGPGSEKAAPAGSEKAAPAQSEETAPAATPQIVQVVRIVEPAMAAVATEAGSTVVRLKTDEVEIVEHPAGARPMDVCDDDKNTKTEAQVPRKSPDALQSAKSGVNQSEEAKTDKITAQAALQASEPPNSQQQQAIIDGKEESKEVKRSDADRSPDGSLDGPAVTSKTETKAEPVESGSAEASRLRSDRALILDFLKTSATQLTYCGLAKLHSDLGEGTICCFFRNNHFSVLRKQGGQLYLLVTDVAFSDVPDVVWEKLSTLDGDTFFTDGAFRVVSRPQAGFQAAAAAKAKDSKATDAKAPQHQSQMGTDEELARQLQRQMSQDAVRQDEEIARRMQQQLGGGHGASRPTPPPPRTPAPPAEPPSANGTVRGIPAAPPSRQLTDEELARRIYETELRQAREAKSGPRHPPPPKPLPKPPVRRPPAGASKLRQISNDEEMARRLHQQEVEAARRQQRGGRRPVPARRVPPAAQRPRPRRPPSKDPKCAIQ